MNKRNIQAVIPAYNVARTINPIIQGLLKSIPDIVVWVIDDGSQDGLNHILIRSSKSIRYHAHSENRGKGTALRTGFKLALADGATLILTMDSDGQHNPNNAINLLNGIQNDRAIDILVGSRDISYRAMPLHRVVSNKVTSYLISKKTGQCIPDSQSGFRIYRRSILEEVKLTKNYFDLETEVLLKAASCGAQISCAKIDTIYLKNNFSSICLDDVIRFIKVFRSTD